MATFHDPHKHIGQLRQALETPNRSVGFLIGAGCPLAVQIAGQPLIPDIAGMTQKITASIAASPDAATFKTVVEQLGKKVPTPNIEDVLSYVRTLITVADKVVIGDLTPASLDALEKSICNSIAELAKADLPASTPYHHLAAWIKGVNRSAPVELFTTNYDLLTESALEAFHVPYFDGFIGSGRAFFDPHAIETESDLLPARWSRLWKLHGSINWWAESSEEPVTVVRSGVSAGSMRLIHPSHLKYDESRQMPYLAMMDRLKHFIKKPGALLITVGYSFSDRHINALLRQALNGNPDAAAFGLLFNTLDKHADAVKLAEKTPNLSLLAKDKGVIGTKSDSWGISISDIGQTGVTKKDPASKEVEVTIGDFSVLGAVLLELIGETTSIKTPDKPVALTSA